MLNFLLKSGQVVGLWVAKPISIWLDKLAGLAFLDLLVGLGMLVILGSLGFLVMLAQLALLVHRQPQPSFHLSS